VVVKDSIDVAGARTGLGLLDGGDLATKDAVIVRRIREAGGLVCGKSKMTELGMDGLGAVMHHPMPGNPRAPGYFPGGSSTGTAVAIASGRARFGLGGDGMGSVRIPAAYCGLVGLKPTHGRLPEEGYPSPAPSMDVPGPMARTAADCALLWQVIAGERPRPLATRAPARVGVIRQLGPELATRSIAMAFRRALGGLGTTIEEVDVPGAEHNPILGMAAAIHEVARCAHASRELSAAGQLNMALGRAVDGAAARIFADRRALLRDAALRALDRVGVLAMPTTAIPPPAVTPALLGGAQDALLLRAIGAYTPLANCTGLPAIAVPCGVDDRRRPLSIMFVGPPGEEEMLLRIALAVEAAGLAEAPINGA
jgi:Asp-tRNA(Asn)/Glu-tRNA(Gln) amidotransferase A subunit family amidase